MLPDRGTDREGGRENVGPLGIFWVKALRAREVSFSVGTRDFAGSRIGLNLVIVL